MYLTPPFARKAHFLKCSHKKAPRNMVIGLLNIELAKDT